MFTKYLLFSVLLFCISIEVIKCDKICETLVPEAITDLQNGSIAVFRSKEVWLFNRAEKQLSGPCPIGQLFKDMSGPIDAAVTFESHESVTEFVGASIYFGEGNFYTFKNLRPYQVEWGALVYLPVSGKQNQIGTQSEEGKRLMSQKLSAAYFDPISSRSKFIFSDKTVLGFNFELGSEYDIPVSSTLESEFEIFGITSVPKNISAALTITLKDKKKSKVFLFDDSEYCEIQIDVQNNQQKCTLRPVSEFFDCNNLNPIKSICGPKTNGIRETFPEVENPITVQTHDQENDMNEVTLPLEVRQTVKVRDSGDEPKPIAPSPTSSSNYHFSAYLLTKLIPFLLFLQFF